MTGGFMEYQGDQRPLIIRMGPCVVIMLHILQRDFCTLWCSKYLDHGNGLG
jgi:hypothetical protein